MDTAATTTIDDAAVGTTADDDCYRCGYALRGIADDQPCPECGLVAGRSRRPSDELHDTRPRWLRRIALGAGLILLAILSVPVWMFGMEAITDWVGGWVGSATTWYRVRQTAWLYAFELSALLLLAGVFLLTSREGYEPADEADRRLRRLLRVAAAAPFAALAVVHVDLEWALLTTGSPFSVPDWSIVEMCAFALGTIGCVPLPLLLFRHLRGLAGRARSAHLAEHCTIVGVGTSITLMCVPAVVMLFENAAQWGLGEGWVRRSNMSLLVALVLSVAATLFPLWSLYLLLSFAVAFRRAARRLRRQWLSNDRALAIPAR